MRLPPRNHRRRNTRLPKRLQFIDYLKRARVQVQLFHRSVSPKRQERRSPVATGRTEGASSPEQVILCRIRIESANANMHDQAAMVLDELAVNESNPLKLNQIT